MPNKSFDRLAYLQQLTQQGTPDWISNAVGPIQAQVAALPGQSDALAYVNPGQATVNIVRPELYTAPIAAHEATHVFQASRNPSFAQHMNAMEPATQAGYDYGGVQGLQANPYKSMGDYNPEQQAEMVEDLADAQSKLTSHMNLKQLQQWDQTKQALERPISQLQQVAAPSNSLAERGDAFLNNYTYGNGALNSLLTQQPLERLMGLISSPSMNTSPLQPQSAPSSALGYANRSKLVR